LLSALFESYVHLLQNSAAAANAAVMQLVVFVTAAGAAVLHCCFFFLSWPLHQLLVSVYRLNGLLPYR
jgi:hypothetical protein